MKQNAASAVLNRIPASADVTIWTAMNMRRSVKSMRLIDADKLKEVIEKEKDNNDYTCRLCMESTKEIIDEWPTAFDVDKVVE